MNYFAHNGVVHTTSGDADMHLLVDSLRLIGFVLVTIVLTWLIYRLYKKISFAKMETKNREDE